jgi:ABC-type multidrug transport system fused ATPase/permease subunit
MLSGASSFSFWAANYIFNFLHFTIVSIIISGIVYAFHHTRDLEGFALWQLCLFFILLESYGITSVCFVGVWSLLPVSHWGLAYSRIFLFCIFTGPLFMLFIISMSDPNTKAPLEFVASFHNMFLCFPPYSLGMGIFYIMANAAHLRECNGVEQFKVEGACDAPRKTARHPWNEFERRAGQEALYSCCVNRRSNSFDLIAYGIGRNLACLLIVLIGSLVIRILKESHFWTTYKKLLAKYEMRSWKGRFPPAGSFEHEIYDYDVLSEILHVENEGIGAPDLVIRKLTKELPGVKKVDELCLKIDRGECFCLLGVAGAGKSATLRMLVGARMPTSGDVTIDGHSLMNDYKNVRKKAYQVTFNLIIILSSIFITADIAPTIPHS